MIPVVAHLAPALVGGMRASSSSLAVHASLRTLVVLVRTILAQKASYLAVLVAVGPVPSADGACERALVRIVWLVAQRAGGQRAMGGIVRKLLSGTLAPVGAVCSVVSSYMTKCTTNGAFLGDVPLAPFVAVASPRAVLGVVRSLVGAQEAGTDARCTQVPLLLATSSAALRAHEALVALLLTHIALDLLVEHDAWHCYFATANANE